MICGKTYPHVSNKIMTGLARLINGIGTGMLNVIVPVWVCLCPLFEWD